MKSRHGPAEVPPAEGAHNLGFTELPAPGPPQTSVQRMERKGPGFWHRWGLAAGWMLWEMCPSACDPQQWALSAVACPASPPAALHCCYDLSHPNFLRLPCSWGDNFFSPLKRFRRETVTSLVSSSPTGCYHKPTVNPLNENKNTKRCMFMSNKNRSQSKTTMNSDDFDVQVTKTQHRQKQQPCSVSPQPKILLI